MLIINIDDSNLETGIPDAGGGITKFYNGQPFTGKIQAFYPNGNLEAEEEYIDSHKNGRQIYYYENGQIEEDYYFKFNQFYGICKTYYESGVLKTYIECNEYGFKLEEKHYDENGNLTGHWLNEKNIL